jgi:hypothetical protein
MTVQVYIRSLEFKSVSAILPRIELDSLILLRGSPCLTAAFDMPRDKPTLRT